MSEIERERVGQALDLLRDALATCVDDAMALVYGPQWDERVAEEDAQRRRGRKFPVSKNDLAVLLKAIYFKQIAPWGNVKTYPRIRSFASEILTLRNLFSHGDDCIHEHSRLLDTANRLLQLLDLPVPGGLEPSVLARKDDLDDRVAVAIAERPGTAIDFFSSELARFGESVEQVNDMLRRVEEIRKAAYRRVLDLSSFEPGSPADDFVQSELAKTVGNTVDKSISSEVLDLLDDTYRLEDEAQEHDSAVLKVAAFFVRCALLNGAQGLALISLAFSEIRDQLDLESTAKEAEQQKYKEARAGLDAEEGRKKLREEWLEESDKHRQRNDRLLARLKLLTELVGQPDIERWRELVRLARELNEGDPTSNELILLGNLQLLDDLAIEDDEALELTRDSVARARMLAAMEPGAHYESWLVLLLRREGELYNDRGQSDDAIRAFARADEIIDRYPAADPHLSAS